MEPLEHFDSPDINQGVAEWKNTEGAVLLDVRSTKEYQSGHIPGSVHLSLRHIGQIGEVVPEKTTPIFVYCLSGARSAQAVAALSNFLGYGAVKNIGGISDYSGPVEV